MLKETKLIEWLIDNSIDSELCSIRKSYTSKDLIDLYKVGNPKICKVERLYIKNAARYDWLCYETNWYEVTNLQKYCVPDLIIKQNDNYIIAWTMQQ